MSASHLVLTRTATFITRLTATVVVSVVALTASGVDGVASARTLVQGATGMTSPRPYGGGFSAASGSARQSGVKFGGGTTSRSTSRVNNGGTTPPGGDLGLGQRGSGAFRARGAVAVRQATGKLSASTSESTGATAPPLQNGRNAPAWQTPSSWLANSIYTSPWQARASTYQWGASAR
jgi:hypothetical protein